MYVCESFAAHMVPVLTYYQLLQSAPSVGSSDELLNRCSPSRGRGAPA
jgi:hypothetical protein